MKLECRTNGMNELLNDYKAVNRMQSEKIELLSKELCEKNVQIEELLRENRILKEKCENTFSFRNKFRDLFKR